MGSKPQLSDSMFKDAAKQKRSRPKKLSADKRILYEIEQLLKLDKHGLKLEHVNKSGRSVINNRDVYRIYKGVCKELGVEPTIVYTGQKVKNRQRIKELCQETENRDLQDFEASI